MTTLQRNLASWAVDKAVQILRGGPQQFNTIALWVTAEAEESFHGGYGFSRRRVVRQALLEAATIGVFGATWRFLANENKAVPCTIWNDTAAAAIGAVPVRSGPATSTAIAASTRARWPRATEKTCSETPAHGASRSTLDMHAPSQRHGPNQP